MKRLRYCFLLVDIGFITYWLITILHLIPAEYLYNNYQSPVMVNWNWSFFPLDMIVSGSGLFSIYLQQKNNTDWRKWAFVSLLLTSISGLQAIAYWAIAGEFSITWWLPNLFLLLYPLFFLPRLFKEL
ncbi:MAG TPA: DUF5360 family protein [Chitinophaga sp.]|uniref:DUF5360 family protein n=1 Tax=Chitinophaga sp. TaxID=1869181 RepID=UPI002C080E99|nr:DUF5360 family protein [Chitinophaga sp.]HVI45164.1 DUF5360 family protein [Chitinophaga sp.]